MVINTLVNEVEELICANACSDRCIDVARYFECKHPCCIKTALMLDWCIQCGCNNKYKEKVRLIEFSVHKRSISDFYAKTCLKVWNSRARMAKETKATDSDLGKVGKGKYEFTSRCFDCHRKLRGSEICKCQDKEAKYITDDSISDDEWTASDEEFLEFYKGLGSRIKNSEKPVFAELKKKKAMFDKKEKDKSKAMVGDIFKDKIEQLEKMTKDDLFKMMNSQGIRSVPKKTKKDELVKHIISELGIRTLRQVAAIADVAM